MVETNTGVAAYLLWLFQPRGIAVIALESRQCRQFLCNIPGHHLLHAFVEKSLKSRKTMHCCIPIFVEPQYGFRTD